MKVMMTDSKDAAMASSVETPTYIVQAAPEQNKSSQRGGITKKQVLIAVSVVLVIAIVLVAILVGVYMFTKTQKEIVQFTFQFKGNNGENIKQQVNSDPNDNVVMFQVTQGGQDSTVVDDFNRGMEIVKTTINGREMCLVTALNRSAALDPSLITGADSFKNGNRTEKSTFAISEDPVVDRSFLTKKAQDLCKDTTLYWVTKQCDQPESQTGIDGGKVKRAVYRCVYQYSYWYRGVLYDRYYCYPI
jgi:hypothetical protein